jgi:uncharacterized membrane-anchored protein
MLSDGSCPQFRKTIGPLLMPSRLQIGILVAAATLIVCSLGVRAELKSAQHSIAEHRLQTQHAQQAASSSPASVQ